MKEERLKQVMEKLKAATTSLPKGTEVKFKPPNETYHRTGTIVGASLADTHYQIQGKRTEAGTIPIHTIPKSEVIPLKDYREYVQQPARNKNPNITSDGDFNTAKYNLKKEESRRRKAIVEERLGFNEGKIILHPSFIGPAVKITSAMAKENGINTAISNDTPGNLWERAIDEDFKNLLEAYAVAALKAWRRILSKPITDDEKSRQVENNVEEFKKVIAGEKKSSSAHDVMQKEGRSAAIDYLKKRRKHRDQVIDMDISDMVNDPDLRKLLNHYTQPQQLPFAMAANKETLIDDLKRAFGKLEPVEQELLKIKYGFHPYERPVDSKDKEASNEEVAENLNGQGMKHPDGRKWNRDTVGQVVKGALGKIRQAKESMAALTFHRDVLAGRELDPSVVWKSRRVPAVYHPAGDFTAHGINYSIIHDGDEAVLIKAERNGAEIEGATFETLIKAVQVGN